MPCFPELARATSILPRTLHVEFRHDLTRLSTWR